MVYSVLSNSGSSSLAAHTMAPTVCDRFLSTGILLQSQVHHRGIFGGKSDTGTVLFLRALQLLINVHITDAM